ncbi:MAG TPA: hypothetical protein VGH74_22150 [Planctomycetaceae bacterium]
MAIVVSSALMACFRSATGAAPDDAVLESWLNRKHIPAAEAQDTLHSFVEKQIQALPVPKTLATG